MENFKDISTQSVRFVKPNTMKVNEATIGTLVESYDGQYGKNWKFTDGSGDIFIVNGTGKLNHLLAKVNPGSLTKIVYLGKETIKEGKMKGKDCHNFQVLVADAAPVAAVTAQTAKSAVSNVTVVAAVDDDFMNEADALLSSITSSPKK